MLDGRNVLRIMHIVTGYVVYDLRCTYCTRAAQAGVNPKVLQTITGHRKIETLLKVYTHVTDEDRNEAAGYSGNAMNRPSKIISLHD